MELAVRRYARNILLLHLGLLAVVLAVVYFASRAIEQSAREQALAQAQSRQEQLANQTARGIESFYQNILSDMDLLPRSDDSQVERTVLPEVLTPARSKNPLGPRGVLVGFVLARQLEERVAHLFVVDKKEMIPRGLMREDLQEELKMGKAPPPPSTRPAVATGRGGGERDAGRRAPQRLAYSGPQPSAAELEIVNRNREWLQGVTSQSVSKFEVFDSVGGLNLIAMPLGPKSQVVVVAAVPVEKVNNRFLTRLNADKDTGAFLVDESLTAMAASREPLVGANLGLVNDAQVKSVIAGYRQDGYRGTKLIREPFKLGDQEFAPAMVTAEPIEVVPGRQWFLLVASPLSEVDRVVSALFDRIVLWSVFVTIAVAGILVSTAVWLIRTRVKLERARMEVIHKELDRARMIQTAWLPRTPPACREIQVAAANYPAQHISGDFYNWFDLPDGRTAIAIGDVTGHGMSAAFLMATTQLLVRTTMQRITDPGRCLEEVNRQLCTQVFNGQFVTMQLLVIDPCGGTIELANAGHPPPLLAAEDPATGHVTLQPLPNDPQFVLGVDADTAYDTERLDLPPDAMLLLYTDGAADVEAPAGNRLGTDGLRRLLAARRATDRPIDAAGLLEAVVNGVNVFRGARPIGDDLTFVALALSGTRAAARHEALEVVPEYG